MQLGDDVLPQRAGPGQPRHDTVGKFPGGLHHQRGERADQHLHRAGTRDSESPVHPVKGAAVPDAALAKQRDEHREVIPHVRGGLLVGEPVQVLDDRPVRYAHAEREPPAAEGLRRRGLLGQRERMPGVGGTIPTPRSIWLVWVPATASTPSALTPREKCTVQADRNPSASAATTSATMSCGRTGVPSTSPPALIAIRIPAASRRAARPAYVPPG